MMQQYPSVRTGGRLIGKPKNIRTPMGSGDGERGCLERGCYASGKQCSVIRQHHEHRDTGGEGRDRGRGESRAGEAGEAGKADNAEAGSTTRDFRVAERQAMTGSAASNHQMAYVRRATEALLSGLV